MEEISGEKEISKLSEGRWAVTLSGQQMEVSFFPPLEEKRQESEDSKTPLGLDFTIPTGLLEEQTRSMVEYILILSAKWELTAFDPQLGRTVRSSDSEIIVSGWKMQSDYILTTVGSDGSTIGGGAHYPDHDSSMGSSTKFWLYVGGFVLFLLLFIRFCV